MDCGCDRVVLDFSELVERLGDGKQLAGWELEISGACVVVELIWRKYGLVRYGLGV